MEREAVLLATQGEVEALYEECVYGRNWVKQSEPTPFDEPLTTEYRDTMGMLGVVITVPPIHNDGRDELYFAQVTPGPLYEEMVGQFVNTIQG